MLQFLSYAIRKKGIMTFSKSSEANIENNFLNSCFSSMQQAKRMGKS